METEVSYDIYGKCKVVNEVMFVVMKVRNYVDGVGILLEDERRQLH